VALPLFDMHFKANVVASCAACNAHASKARVGNAPIAHVPAGVDNYIVANDGTLGVGCTACCACLQCGSIAIPHLGPAPHTYSRHPDIIMVGELIN
jgi:hypothetical protein